MKIASVASPAWALVAAGVALGASLVLGRTHRVEPAPIYVPTADVGVSDHARYWSIDLDGDGVPELVAETADRSAAVIVKAYGHAPIGTIPLRFPGNPCQSELAIENERLVAHDYAGPDCHENQWRRFRIVDGGLSTVTVWDTEITIVDN